MGYKPMVAKLRAPNPGKMLYQGLFIGADRNNSICKIAAGIELIIQNTANLIDDMKYLAKDERFARASFLLTTANEEIAKVYILLDACKLDFIKHENVTRRLCRGFYNHVTKHAYLEVTDVFRIWRYRTMPALKDSWEVRVQEWFPGNYESGEPDEPHDTVPDRQWPLYVDYDLPDKKWLALENRWFKFRFTGLDEEIDLENSDLRSASRGLYIKSPYDRLLLEFARVQDALKRGLFSEVSLQILHDVFRKKFVCEKTPEGDIEGLYENLLGQLKKALGTNETEVMASPLGMWPLYTFV